MLTLHLLWLDIGAAEPTVGKAQMDRSEHSQGCQDRHSVIFSPNEASLMTATECSGAHGTCKQIRREVATPYHIGTSSFADIDAASIMYHVIGVLFTKICRPNLPSQ